MAAGRNAARPENAQTMQPTVSVIVPCYNEAATIGSLLQAVAGQTLPIEKMEIIIADGLSTDGTRRAIAEFQQTRPDLGLRVVDNPRRTIPSALNEAIRNSRGEFIVRLDAHCVPIPEYVERCVRNLELGRGANVGGVWTIQPGGRTWAARGIAAAAAHPLGAGDALYRLGGPARAVDTVPFGAFRRTLIRDIGEFDETLLTNEDYEFNVRVRAKGGIVWMDPEIRSIYFARPSFAALARQYWRYGFWKLRMLLRYPGSIRWRQAMPALFVLAIFLLAAASPFWVPAALALVATLGIYVLTLLAAGIQMSVRGRDAALLPGAMLSLATMHLAWGAGFWTSLLTRWMDRNG